MLTHRTSWSAHFHPLWFPSEPCPPPSCQHALLKPPNHVVPSISLIMSSQEWQYQRIIHCVLWGWAFTQHNSLVIYQRFYVCLWHVVVLILNLGTLCLLLDPKDFLQYFLSKVLYFTWESSINIELVFVQGMRFRLWFGLFNLINVFIFHLWKAMASAPHKEQVVLPLLNCFCNFVRN